MNMGIAAAVLFLSASCAVAQPSYTVVDMDALDAMSVNGSMAVGERKVPGASYWGAAVVWTRETGVVELLRPPNGARSRAVDVSGDGSVIVGKTIYDVSNPHPSESWLWTAATGLIPVTVPNAIAVNATCISRDGSTVGGIVILPNNSQYHSFVWTPQGGGRLVPEGSNYQSWLHALSPDGHMAIGSASSSGGTHGALWASTYVWCENNLPPPGYSSAINYAWTSNGMLIVGAISTGASAGTGFRWTPEQGIVAIPLPAGSPDGALRSVSDDGVVAAGWYVSSSSPFRTIRAAALSFQGGPMIDAAAYFNSRNVGNLGPMWEIAAISAHGRVFAGPRGDSYGVTHAFIVDIGGCSTADFNNDNVVGADGDIEDFFRCLCGSCCATCESADFNHDGDTGTDADIESFFRVLAGGQC